jgi:hypothetical protein
MHTHINTKHIQTCTNTDTHTETHKQTYIHTYINICAGILT